MADYGSSGMHESVEVRVPDIEAAAREYVSQQLPLVMFRQMTGLLEQLTRLVDDLSGQPIAGAEVFLVAESKTPLAGEFDETAQWTYPTTKAHYENLVALVNQTDMLRLWFKRRAPLLRVAVARERVHCDHLDAERGELWFSGETAEAVLLQLDARRRGLGWRRRGRP